MWSTSSRLAEDDDRGDDARRWRRRVAVAETALVAILVAGGVVGAQLAVDGEIENAEMHAEHDQPGKPRTYPLTKDVRYVTGDNTATGGHGAVEGNRRNVGAYGMGMKI